VGYHVADAYHLFDIVAAEAVLLIHVEVLHRPLEPSRGSVRAFGMPIIAIGNVNSGSGQNILGNPTQLTY